jgi:hypothetical protein
MIQRSRRFLFRTRHIYDPPTQLRIQTRLFFSHSLVAKQLMMKGKGLPFGNSTTSRHHKFRARHPSDQFSARHRGRHRAGQDRTRSISGRVPLRLLIQSSMEGKANARSLVSYYYEAKASSMTVNSPVVQPRHLAQARLPGAVAKVRKKKT